MTCPGLPSPPNGKVLLTGMDVNKQAFYSCNDKFTLMGQTIRICLPTGSWSGSAPLCARKYGHLYMHCSQLLLGERGANLKKKFIVLGIL